MPPHPAASVILNLSLALLREESGSDVPVISEAVMLQSCAQADREALRALRRGGGTTTRERALEWGTTLLSDTALTAEITSASVTVAVDTTTGADSSGAAIVWDNDMPDIFYYTAITATSFTTVTGLSFNHEDNDSVQFLYALPSNFGRFRHSEDYGDGVSLNGTPLRYMEGPPNPGYFSIVDDGTTIYLWLYRGAAGDVSVWFDKDSNTIDSTDDLISLPEDWLYFYAWRVISLSLFGRGDYAIIPVADAKASKELLDLLKDRNIGRRLRVRQYQQFGADRDLSIAAGNSI